MLRLFHLFRLRIVLLSALMVNFGPTVSEILAQVRLGSSGSTVLSPRPAMPLQSRIAPGEPQQPTSPGRPLSATLVDPGPIGAETTTNIYFAQVAVAGGYSTIFTFLNTGSTPVNGRLILKKSNGEPFSVNLNEPGGPDPIASDGRVLAVGSEFPFQPPIPPGGTRILTATGVNPGAPVDVGWARVENIGGSLGGVATFQLVEGGVLRTIAGVLASTTVPVATVPVDDFNPSDFVRGRATGYAVANPNNENINIRIVVVSENGTIVATLNPPDLNPLRPQEHKARFLFQDQNPVPASFKGSMVLIPQGGRSFVVVALVLNQGLFTAIPVIPEKAPSIN